MDGIDTAHLVYLVLLMVMVVGWFVASGRQSLGKTAQHALMWGLIFFGVIAAIGLWDDIRHTISPMQSVDDAGGQIILPRGNDGHYYLSADVNGQNVDFVVDTGASQIVLTQADAQAVGIDTNNLSYVGQANTANGTVHIAPVRLEEIAVGSIVDTNVRAVVNGGQMDKSLLGMTYLQRFSKVEIEGNKLILTR